MTSYQLIYDRFINKITDYHLLQLQEEEILEICKKYLRSAITKFTECKQDLSIRNDNFHCFNISLTEIEQEILANLMIVEWLSPKIYNITVLKQFIGDNEYKGFSQANHLKELQSLCEHSQDEVERLMMDYAWDDNESIGELI